MRRAVPDGAAPGRDADGHACSTVPRTTGPRCSATWAAHAIPGVELVTGRRLPAHGGRRRAPRLAGGRGRPGASRAAGDDLDVARGRAHDGRGAAAAAVRSRRRAPRRSPRTSRAIAASRAHVRARPGLRVAGRVRSVRGGGARDAGSTGKRRGRRARSPRGSRPARRGDRHASSGADAALPRRRRRRRAPRASLARARRARAHARRHLARPWRWRLPAGRPRARRRASRRGWSSRSSRSRASAAGPRTASRCAGSAGRTRSRRTIWSCARRWAASPGGRRARSPSVAPLARLRRHPSLDTGHAWNAPPSPQEQASHEHSQTRFFTTMPSPVGRLTLVGEGDASSRSTSTTTRTQRRRARPASATTAACAAPRPSSRSTSPARAPRSTCRSRRRGPRFKRRSGAALGRDPLRRDGDLRRDRAGDRPAGRLARHRRRQPPQPDRHHRPLPPRDRRRRLDDRLRRRPPPQAVAARSRVPRRLLRSARPPGRDVTAPAGFILSYILWRWREHDRSRSFARARVGPSSFGGGVCRPSERDRA